MPNSGNRIDVRSDFDTWPENQLVHAGHALLGYGHRRRLMFPDDSLLATHESKWVFGRGENGFVVLQNNS